MMEQEDQTLEKVQAALMTLSLGGKWPLGKHEPFIGCPFIQRSLVRIESLTHLTERARLAISAMVLHPKEMADLCHPYYIPCFTCDGNAACSGLGYCKPASKIIHSYEIAVQEAGI